MEHRIIARKTWGEGMSYTIQPRCSCGWEGTPHQAWEDWQYTLVAEEEGTHIANALKEVK